MQARRWYTTSQSLRWLPEDGVNDLYRQEVERVRWYFQLQRQQRGWDVALDGQVWLPYILQGERIYVKVATFGWGMFGRPTLSGVSSGLEIRPASFTFWLRVGRPKTEPADCVTDEQVDIFFDSTSTHAALEVWCGNEHPRESPRLRIYPNTQVELIPHLHHWYMEGDICTFMGAEDWPPEKRNLVTAVEVALDWIVWHNQTFGW